VNPRDKGAEIGRDLGGGRTLMSLLPQLVDDDFRRIGRGRPARSARVERWCASRPNARSAPAVAPLFVLQSLRRKYYSPKQDSPRWQALASLFANPGIFLVGGPAPLRLRQPGLLRRHQPGRACPTAHRANQAAEGGIFHEMKNRIPSVRRDERGEGLSDQKHAFTERLQVIGECRTCVWSTSPRSSK